VAVGADLAHAQPQRRQQRRERGLLLEALGGAELLLLGGDARVALCVARRVLLAPPLRLARALCGCCCGVCVCCVFPGVEQPQKVL
jgi:hypothetical protein